MTLRSVTLISFPPAADEPAGLVVADVVFAVLAVLVPVAVEPVPSVLPPVVLSVAVVDSLLWVPVPVSVVLVSAEDSVVDSVPEESTSELSGAGSNKAAMVAIRELLIIALLKLSRSSLKAVPPTSLNKNTISITTMQDMLWTKTSCHPELLFFLFSVLCVLRGLSSGILSTPFVAPIFFNAGKQPLQTRLYGFIPLKAENLAPALHCANTGALPGTYALESRASFKQ